MGPHRPRLIGDYSETYDLLRRKPRAIGELEPPERHHDRADPARAALFLAGKAFIQYRKAGGSRTGVLPDFFIGAHAAVAQVPLLTRDDRRYRTYFPSLTLISPDTTAK